MLPDPSLCCFALLRCTEEQWKWEQTEFGKDRYCRLCGEGDLSSFSCDNPACHFSFCEGCIIANCGSTRYKKISILADAEEWRCFKCTQGWGTSAATAAAASAGASKASTKALFQASAAVNKFRTHLHLTARAAYGGLTIRTLFNAYELQRRVPTFTYFNPDKITAIRKARGVAIPATNPDESPAAGAAAFADRDLLAKIPGALPYVSLSAPLGSLGADNCGVDPADDVSDAESEMDEDEDLPRPQALIDAKRGAAKTKGSEGKKRNAAGAAAAPSTAASSSSAAAAAAPSSSAAPPRPPALKKLICFSFFLSEWCSATEHTPYVYGLLENIRRICAEWPGWTVRIYVDDSFQIPAPVETTHGVKPDLNGVVCSGAYAQSLRSAWYTHLLPLLHQLAAAGHGVEIRRFNWSVYQDKDRIHHGLVGTCARFLALGDLGWRGGVGAIIMADTDNLLTPAAKRIQDDFFSQKECLYQRYHDPRYPIPVWAGGFSVQVPAAVWAGDRSWLNPHANIESLFHAWAVKHARAPMLIKDRPEMFRERITGLLQMYGNTAEKQLPKQTLKANQAQILQRKLEMQERRRERLRAGIEAVHENDEDDVGDEATAAAAAAAAVNVKVAPSSPAPSSQRKSPRQRSTASPMQDEAAPVRAASSSSAIAAAATAATPASRSSSSSKPEHKDATNPHMPRDHSEHFGDAEGSLSSPPTSQEQRRSSRGHASTIAYQKEIERQAASSAAAMPMDIDAATAAAVSSLPISVSAAEVTPISSDDDCVEIDPPPSSGSKPKIARHTSARKKARPISQRRKNRPNAGSEAAAAASDDPAAAAAADAPSSSGLLKVDNDGIPVEFFQYGSDQVFLADHVWPIMQASCLTSWSLLPEARLRNVLKVWPPPLTAEEQAGMRTAQKYWNIMEWMPNNLRPPTGKIEHWIKDFVLKHFATFLRRESRYDPPSAVASSSAAARAAGPGFLVRYERASTVAARLAAAGATVPVPFIGSPEHVALQAIIQKAEKVKRAEETAATKADKEGATTAAAGKRSSNKRRSAALKSKSSAAAAKRTSSHPADADSMLDDAALARDSSSGSDDDEPLVHYGDDPHSPAAADAPVTPASNKRAKTGEHKQGESASPNPARRQSRPPRRLINEVSASATPAAAVAASSSSSSAARAAPATRPAPVAYAEHYADECEWGCKRLHDASLCQAVSADSANLEPCANQALLAASSPNAFRLHMAQGGEHKEEPAAPATVAAEAAEAENQTMAASTVAASPTTATDPPEESKHDPDESMPAAVAAADAESAAADAASSSSVIPTIRERSGRAKQSTRPLRDYVVAGLRRSASALPPPAHMTKPSRVVCACDCDFCRPAVFLLEDAPSSPSAPLFHPRLLPESRWPWDVAGACAWLASLPGDSLVPLQAFLQTASSAARARTLPTHAGPPGILQLLNAHPTKLVKLLQSANRDAGTRSERRQGRNCSPCMIRCVDAHFRPVSLCC